MLSVSGRVEVGGGAHPVPRIFQRSFMLGLIDDETIENYGKDEVKYIER